MESNLAPDVGPAPTRVVVTGAAGFIGHHTVSLLLDDGIDVIGIDGFSDYYDRSLKERNLRQIMNRPGFQFIESWIDPATCEVFGDADAVIHLAAQPGVRESWDNFEACVEHNVLATKCVLDAAMRHGISRVIYASSSSVYGDVSDYPTAEQALTEPRSPYGITKLAGEQLVQTYSATFGLSTTSLRYFTVYGPRQRPDMAMQRLLTCALEGEPFTLFGDGSQVRDFTFVTDVARANVQAAVHSDVASGSVFNVCGGQPATLNEVIEIVERITDRPVGVVRAATASGDVTRTGGDTSAITKALGWHAQTSLEDGLRAQFEAIVDGPPSRAVRR